MSKVIRESDIDVDALKARTSPVDVEEAVCGVVQALAALDGLRKHRTVDEPKHELVRALELVHETLNDVLYPE
jgi:hypothetical protein